MMMLSMSQLSAKQKKETKINNNNNNNNHDGHRRRHRSSTRSRSDSSRRQVYTAAATATATAALLLMSTSSSIIMTTTTDAFVLPTSRSLTYNPTTTPFSSSTSSNARSNPFIRHEFNEGLLSTTTSTPITSTTALFAVRIVDEWIITDDGRIQGIVRSPDDDNDDEITTSPLTERMLRRGNIKQSKTVTTISGSKYKLGIPKSNPQTTLRGMVTPRNVLGGDTFGGKGERGKDNFSIGGGFVNPLNNNEITLQQYLAKKKQPQQSIVTSVQQSTSPKKSTSKKSSNSSSSIGNNNNALTPLLGTAAVALGAAIGSGTLTKEGFNLDKITNSRVWEVPTADVLNKGKELFQSTTKSFTLPTLPDNINLPFGLGKSKSSSTTSPSNPAAMGREPYQVQLPYLEERIKQAEQQATKTQSIAPPSSATTSTIGATEKERLQQLEREIKMKQEEDAILAQQQAEQEAIRRQQEEMARQEAIAREKAAAEEAARVQREAQEAQQQLDLKLKEAEIASSRTSELEADYMLKQKRLNEGSILLRPRLQKQADEAMVKLQATQQEFSRILQEAEELARKAKTTVNIPIPTPAWRTTTTMLPSTTSSSSAPATQAKPPLTYESWQQRQRQLYEIAKRQPPSPKDLAAARRTVADTDAKSVYDKWQQRLAAKKLASMTGVPSTATSVSPAAPIANQIISGVNAPSSTVIAENTAATVSLLVAGSVGTTGLVYYAFNKNNNDDDEWIQSQRRAISSMATPSMSSLSSPPPPPPPPPPQQQARKTYRIDQQQPQENMEQESSSRQVRKTISLSSTQAAAPNPAVGNYLDVISGSSGSSSSSSSTIKASYSPFGSGKPMAGAAAASSSTTGNTLYAPPATTMSSSSQDEFMPEQDTREYSFEESTSSSSEEQTSAGGSGSYLNALAGGTADTVGKKSYSPFGSKPMAAYENTLYAPPASSLSSIDYTESMHGVVESSSSFSDPEVRGGGSYLEALAGSDAAVSPKKSYSPFGSKPMETNSAGNMPYMPPSQGSSGSSSTTAVASSYEAVEENSMNPMSGGSYLEALSGQQDYGSTKKSYSPYGSGKFSDSSSTSNALYSPPMGVSSSDGMNGANGSYSNAPAASTNEYVNGDDSMYDENSSYGGSYLDALNGSTSSPTKTSYSPFGSTKPKAPSDDSLYSPPSSHTESSTLSAADDDMYTTSRSSAKSYIEFLSGPDIIDKVQRSYAPFPSDIILQHYSTSSDSLYKAAPSFNSQSSTLHVKTSEQEPLPTGTSKQYGERSSIENTVVEKSVDETTSRQDLKYLDSLAGSVSTFLKNAFSPYRSEGYNERNLWKDNLAHVHAPIDLFAGLKLSSTPDFAMMETNRIRNAYDEWCLYYDKQKDDTKYEIFSSHFKICERYHHDTGTPLMLNEYADLTEEEYKTKADDFWYHKIQKAYEEWCEYYGKAFDKNRLEVFSANFLLVEKYHAKTGEALVMNEFADLTEDEYRIGEGRIRNAYKEWCAYFAKEHDNLRYGTFKQHFLVVERFVSETGASLMLNEFADMTETEYVEAVANRNKSYDSEVEDRILHAYRQFCEWYDKVADETRLKVFAVHFLIVERYHEATGEALVLNKYADLTEEEYRMMK